MTNNEMSIEERAVMWQGWAAHAYEEAVSELRSGDLCAAMWWQNCGKMDHEAMWSLLAGVLGVSIVDITGEDWNIYLR